MISELRRHGSAPARLQPRLQSKTEQNRTRSKIQSSTQKGNPHNATQRSNFGVGDTHTEEGHVGAVSAHSSSRFLMSLFLGALGPPVMKRRPQAGLKSPKYQYKCVSLE